MIKNKIINFFSLLLETGTNQNEELIYANVWHDTIKGIPWIDDTFSISPGRWAVGYNYLYVMTRILNDFKPKKILEMGLGISTSLISAYMKWQISEKKDELEHIVLEHDANWIKFYTKSHSISDATKVKKQNLISEKTSSGIIYKYQDISDSIRDKKFNVISIDGPFGSYEQSRTDIIKFLPNVLEKDFCIIMDDYNRLPEKKTIQRIRDVLSECGINTCFGVYKGNCDVSVIASESNRFLCSL